METIELAAGRMREMQRPRPAAAPAYKSVAPPPSPIAAAPPALAIKTRVLCDYAESSSEQPAAVPALPADAVAAPRGALVPVALLSALLGAGVMYGLMSLPGAPGVERQVPARVVQVPPAVAAPLVPAAAPPAEAPTPRVTAAAPPTPVADPVREAQVLVANWAQAWSDRDVATYLGFYSSAFKPDKGMTRTAWEAARRKRLAGARSINVAVHDLHVETSGPDRLIVRFSQDYAADTYRETGTPKQLRLVREGGAWRIAAEVEDTRGLAAG